MNQHSTSTFGRGWIPMERDIGLPDDQDPFAHRRAGRGPVLSADGLTEYVNEEEAYHSSPLPPAGGVGGGQAASAAYASAHPNPSRRREGLFMSLPFTLERRVRFLHILATSGNVRRACEVVGVSPQSAYVHKRRDAAFAHGWAAALLLARDAAEEMLAERALHGVRETIFYRGEAVGSRVRHDPRLLLAHLARLDRHAERAETAQDPAPGIAARFDDYLAELAEAEARGCDPLFEPPIDEFDVPPQWTPAHPTRAEALRAAREEVLHDFPGDVADLTPEAVAGIDLDETDSEDLLDAALAKAQHTAETAAAQAWDADHTARLATLEAIFAGELPSDPPHFCEAQMAEDPSDPPHFCEAQMGRGTVREADGGGVTSAAPPIETKAPESPSPLGRRWNGGIEPSAENPIETKSRPFPLNPVNPVNLGAFNPAFTPPSAAHRVGVRVL